MSNNNKPSQNNNNNKQDNEWSKSYEIKFDLYEDQSNNDQNNETQETKKDTTQPPTSANNEDNTNNENDKKENDTEIVYGDSPEIKEETKPTNVMSKPPPMNIRVSADFAGFIDAHTPRKSPTSQNINFSPKSEKKEDINIASQTTPLSIGTEKINFSTYPQTPSKSQKSMNRVNIFLTNDSDEEKEEEDLDVKDIENEIREQKQFRCMECICYLMFLVLFTGMAIFSIGSGDSNYTTTNSMRKPLIDVGEFIGWNGISEKKFMDVSTVEDVYEYTRQVLLPFLMSDGRMINNTRVYYVQNHHILLGGIRLRQIRQLPLDCKVMSFNDSDCYKQDDIDKNPVIFYSNENDSENLTYSYIDSSVLLDQRYAGKFESYPGGGYIQDLALDFNDSIDIINQLQEFDWIDGSTLCLTIDWTTYNPSKSLHTVARLVFEMATSGIFVIDEIKTWKFDRYTNNTSGFMLFLIHVIFILFVFVISGFFLIDIYRNYCHKKQDKFWNQWRIMDILNLIIFYITIGLFIHNENYQKSLINIYEYREPYQSFRRLQALSLLEQFSFAINGFILWIKLFKYLSFHPKFKFLFFMLQRGLQDIVMFIVLLFVFYLAFALSGFIIFSSDVSAYRTYGLSVISMNLYMLTEMNYSDLTSSSRLFGSVYYFSWLIWMTFILVNVFIAILIDSYAKTQVEIELNNQNAIHFNVFDKGRQYIKRLKFAQLMSRFDAIDEDGDDNVDVNEIAKALQINLDDAEMVMKKYDKDGNGILDRKEFEKLKQKMIRDKMEQKPDYIKLKTHDNLTEQVDDMEDLLNKVLQIDPVGKRALKARQGLKRKESLYKD